MKNAKILNFKLSLLAFSSVLLIFTFSGCNEPLQRVFDYPDITSVDDLVPEAVKIIQEGLADDNPVIRVKAIEVIATTKRIRLMPKVQRLLKDDFVPVRFAAAQAVGDLEYRLAENEVAQLLEDRNENVRIAAAYCLAKLGYPESFKTLRKAIASSDQTVRANAAMLLGKSGDKSTLKFLWWTLGRKDSHDTVRLNAVEAIARLGDEQILEKKLWSLVYSGYSDVRLVGIEGLGALGTTKARDILITKLDDDVLEVRLAAAEWLGMLGDNTGEPRVLEVFTNKNLTAGLDKEDLERVKARTALAIGQIGTAPLIKFLPRFLKDKSKFVRIAAVKAVFQCVMKD